MKNKALVIYDSYFHNTEKVAKKIGEAVSKKMEIKVVKVGEIKPEQVNEQIKLLIIGSPTRGFRPTPAVDNFIRNLPKLNNTNVLSFDTRICAKDIDSKVLKPFLTFMMGTFGYAAEPLSKELKKKGGREIGKPGGFLVKDKEGPLKEGELERAGKWIEEALEKVV
jgi:flavodoxin I